MSWVESSARIEENDIHKSQWILSSADLFLLSQAKIAVMEHEELTFVTEWAETTVWDWQRYMPCGMWRGKKQMSSAKNWGKEQFHFPGLQKDFKGFFLYVEGNFKVTITSVLGQYSHWISERSKLEWKLLWMGLYTTKFLGFCQVFLHIFWSFGYYWLKGRTRKV